MKKLFLYLTACTIVVACGKNTNSETDEKNDTEQIEGLVLESIKGTLYIPESYDPISMDLDSMFINVYSEQNFNLADDIIRWSKEYEKSLSTIEYKTNHIESMRDIGLPSGYYKSDINELNQEKKKIEKTREKLQNAVKIVRADYWSQANKGELKGFVIDHRFRAKNNYGNVGICEYMLFLDKDKTNIVGGFDANDSKIKRFNKVIEFLIKLGPDDIDGQNIDWGEFTQEISYLRYDYDLF